MKLPDFSKIQVLLGIILMLIIFILPISYTSFTFPTAKQDIQEWEDIKGYNFPKLIHHEKIEKIDSFLEKHHKRINFQGNVLVSYKGDLLYNKSFGYSNPEKKTPLTDQHVFQLASVTKQFTAMGIMILKERGLLSYSDTVTQYINKFPYPGITIRMLLNHTSGLPNYMWLLENYWHKKRTPYNDDVIKLLNKHQLHLYFKPGTRFSYSNTGYVMLASVIEAVSHMRYDKFMEKNIFSPLNMENSYVSSTAYRNNRRPHLNGYRRWGRHFRSIPPTINDGTVGDKGIYSNITDLYKWDKALYENQLISKKTKMEAYEPLELKNGNHYPYGFGFRLKKSHDKRMVYHYGKWNGFRTGIIRFIEDTSTIIILNHTNRPQNSSITRNVEKILMDNKSKQLSELTHPFQGFHIKNLDFSAIQRDNIFLSKGG